MGGGGGGGGGGNKRQGSISLSVKVLVGNLLILSILARLFSVNMYDI